MGGQVLDEKPDCAKWARDVSAHVTRTMDNSTPYDQATLPSSPPRTHTPRPNRNGENLPAFQFLHRTAAHPHRARPADYFVARDALDHDRQPGYCTVSTRTLDSQSSQKKQALTPISKPLNNLLSDLFQPDIPQSPTTPTHNKHQLSVCRGVVTMPTQTIVPPSMPTIPKAAPRPRPVNLDLTSQVLETAETPTSPKRQLSWSARVRRRRPVEIFDSTFNFWAPSRRRAKYSPPISPRQCVPWWDCDSPRPSAEEPRVKKQKLDGCSAKINTWPTHGLDECSRDLGHVEPAGVSVQEDESRRLSAAMRLDPHPGDPVDFGTLYQSSVEEDRQEEQEPEQTDQPYQPDNQEQNHESQEEYDTFLNEWSHHPSPILFPVDIDQYRAHAPAIESQHSTEPQTPQLSPTTPLRQRSSTTPSLPSLTRSSSTRASSPTSSTRQSDSSTHRFLIHIRASQEARRRRSTGDYVRSLSSAVPQLTPIFAKDDDDDKWLWGKEPL